MGLIYKITNNINGKSYIGQTQLSLKKRWDEHIRASKIYDYKFYRAIRKYGIECFSQEIIEEVPNKLLNEREIYWIAFYDTYKNGYNSTLGGDGSLQIDKNLIEKLWDDGKNIQQIANEIGCCKGTVLSTLQNYKNYSNKESVKRGHISQEHRVCQYDLNGNYIQTFDTVADAARQMGVHRKAISSCCKRDRPSCKNFLWRYEGDEPPIDYVHELKKRRQIKQYDLNEKFIKIFNSISDAAKTLGISRSAVGNCCSGRTKSAGGYIWKYVEEYEEAI